MNMESTTTLLETAVRLRRDKNQNIVFCFWGETGVGKSSLVKLIADKLGLMFYDFRAAVVEMGDVLGMPYIEEKRTCFAEPHWWPQEGTEGILFIDEPNRARTDVLNGLFQLVYDRQVGEHILPDGWTIVLAANPATEDYDVNDFEKALLDRFIHVVLAPESKEWVDWAKNTGYSKDAIGYLEKYPQQLGKVSTSLPFEINPSPRSWERVLMLVDELPKDLWMETFSGIVGSTSAINFIQHMDSNIEKPVSADEILENYKGFKKDIKSQSGGKKPRFDLLRMTSDDIVRTCKNFEDDDKYDDFTNTNKENLKGFIMDLPRDLAFSVVKELVKNCPRIKRHVDFDEIYDRLAKSKKLNA